MSKEPDKADSPKFISSFQQLYFEVSGKEDVSSMSAFFSLPQDKQWVDYCNKILRSLKKLDSSAQREFFNELSRYAAPETVATLFKDLDIVEFLTSLPKPFQMTVIEMVLYMRASEVGAEVLKKILPEIVKFLPKIGEEAMSYYLRQLFEKLPFDEDFSLINSSLSEELIKFAFENDAARRSFIKDLVSLCNRDLSKQFLPKFCKDLFGKYQDQEKQTFFITEIVKGWYSSGDPVLFDVISGVTKLLSSTNLDVQKEFINILFKQFEENAIYYSWSKATELNLRDFGSLQKLLPDVINLIKKTSASVEEAFFNKIYDLIKHKESEPVLEKILLELVDLSDITTFTAKKQLAKGLLSLRFESAGLKHKVVLKIFETLPKMDKDSRGQLGETIFVSMLEWHNRDLLPKVFLSMIKFLPLITLYNQREFTIEICSLMKSRENGLSKLEPKAREKEIGVLKQFLSEMVKVLPDVGEWAQQAFIRALFDDTIFDDSNTIMLDTFFGEYPDGLRGISAKSVKFINQLSVFKKFQKNQFKEEPLFIKSLSTKETVGKILESSAKLQPYKDFNPKDFHPIISLFLKKVTTCKAVIEQGKLIELATMLQKVISQDEFAKTALYAVILPGTTAIQADIVTVDGNFVGGYSTSTGDIVVPDALTIDIRHSASMLFHEFMHKVANFVFQNSYKPVFKVKSLAFELESPGLRELEEIMKSLEKAEKAKNYALFNGTNYKKEDYAKESIAHFIEERVDERLIPERIQDRGIFIESIKLTEWLKKYPEPILKQFAQAVDLLEEIMTSEYSIAGEVLGYTEGFKCEIVGDDSLVLVG